MSPYTAHPAELTPDWRVHCHAGEPGYPNHCAWAPAGVADEPLVDATVPCATCRCPYWRRPEADPALRRRALCANPELRSLLVAGWRRRQQAIQSEAAKAAKADTAHSAVPTQPQSPHRRPPPCVQTLAQRERARLDRLRQADRAARQLPAGLRRRRGIR